MDMSFFFEDNTSLVAHYGHLFILEQGQVFLSTVSSHDQGICQGGVLLN